MKSNLARLLFEERSESFACPRCKAMSARTLAADRGLMTFRQCPSCRSCFIVRRTWLSALALVVIAMLIPALLMEILLVPLVLEGELSPLVVLAIFAAVSLPLVFLLRVPLARRLLRFEYVGRHAT